MYQRRFAIDCTIAIFCTVTCSIWNSATLPFYGSISSHGVTVSEWGLNEIKDEERTKKFLNVINISKPLKLLPLKGKGKLPLKKTTWTFKNIRNAACLATSLLLTLLEVAYNPLILELVLCWKFSPFCQRRKISNEESCPDIFFKLKTGH